MILLDTHVLIWLMDDWEKIGATAQNVIRDATLSSSVYVSVITPWEISMLASKGRLQLKTTAQSFIDRALDLPSIQLAEITPRIAVDAGALPGEIRGDPADCMLIATARMRGFPLVTADGQILRYAQAGHVNAIDARR